MFATALILSGIAAWYAIAGLMAIFAAAAIPIAIMGGTLEVSKLVVASWLYHNWKEIPKLLKSYFVIALFVLMTLTSMGIFGYLSKAHLDQAVPTGDVQAKISLIDEKINQEKEIINESRKTLNQLDQQVNETMARTATQQTDRGVRRSVNLRKAQAEERKQLYETISSAQANIGKLNEEKAPLSSQIREIEAEVGPIKYIAQLIYGDQINETLLEKAVRIVILMIVVVFDPLAVLMLVAANWSLKRRKQPKIDSDKDSTEKFFSDGKQLAKAIDANEGKFPTKDDKRTQSIIDSLYDKEYGDYLEYLEKTKSQTKTEWSPGLRIKETETNPADTGKDFEKPLEYDSHGRLMTATKNSKK
jgi:hypothetical protein